MITSILQIRDANINTLENALGGRNFIRVERYWFIKCYGELNLMYNQEGFYLS